MTLASLFVEWYKGLGTGGWPMRKFLLGFTALAGFVFAAIVAQRGESTTPATSKRQQLQVGFASRDITPEVGDGKPPVYMAGFGHNRVADGVNDPLFARAVVLSDGNTKIALVSLDLVGFFYPNALNVRRSLPGYAHVVVSSTHNHEGPDTLGLWGPSQIKSGINPAYLKRVETEAVAAIKAAEAAMSPAKARFGTARARELLADGREPFIFHDELYVLRFDAPDSNKPLGILVNWHCHPETLADKNTKVSADYVGYCVNALARKYGCPVAYFTGTVGGLMTSLGVKVRDEQGTVLPDRSLAKTIEYGKQLARVAERAVTDSTPTILHPISIARSEVYIPLANPLYKLGRTLGVLDREAFRWKNDPYTAGGKLLPKTSDGELCVATEVSVLSLGEVKIACIPGEIYPEIVLGGVPDPADTGADFPDAPREPTIYDSIPAKHKMLIGLANDEIGYIIPKRQWDEKPPYCYNRKKKQYGEENSCGPETAPIICNAVQKLGRAR
jgi:hypothetical protein